MVCCFSSGSTGRKSGSDNLTLYDQAEPVYTVTVPETIEVAARGNTDVTVTAGRYEKHSG